ncbi:protein YLS7-like [Andrographis paniculata]|uniref:protein YLS7-like n=1 Tax=Andrographis paniculata TaxID=175694 RepID=UPI0021E84EA3|nr:protein YLS7-like [Andrographis paniculata]XP_051121153.1 protein YLS7-like [Andrographis paniculata]
MPTSSTKDSTQIVYPKTVLSIVPVVGGLALFLIFVSTLLVRGYFYGVDSIGNVELKPAVSQPIHEPNDTVSTFVGGSLNSTGLGGNVSDFYSQHVDRSVASGEAEDMASIEDGGITNSTVSGVNVSNVNSQHGNGSSVSGGALGEETSTTEARAGVVDSGCNLYHGNWVYDPTGPLYSNNSCPVLTQMQNCQGNGRPDKNYENWRWKPSQCELPRFDPKKFLELMRGKTLAFIGDSVARNQMESMLCILWQVEVPKNRGNKKMHRYYFRSTSTMIVRMWSSWLVHQTSEPFDYAPAGVVKIHLDIPDETFMKHTTSFDVLVLSSGHWFAKQSVYILNNEIVGGQLWWPDKSRKRKIDNIEAFRISVETTLAALGTHPNYTGLTIVRSYSPDHYEGGNWNTGGSCTGKVRPAVEEELVESGFTNVMHEKQLTEFDVATKKKTNKSKMIFMDITKAFSYRHDGHPGPYRSPDPKKKTTRGPDGKPPPQDCLHWCMPGPVDTWNEMVFETIRRELNDRENNIS